MLEVKIRMKQRKYLYTALDIFYTVRIWLLELTGECQYLIQ